MAEILRNKNQTTRFQILVALADGGPNIRQQEIARKLDVTPQAISDYISQLIRDGLLAQDGRSQYRITNNGVNWMIKVMRELRSYLGAVEKAVNNISVSAAVAGDDFSKGQKVGLKMRGGLLVATAEIGQGATGIAAMDARAGDDIGITGIDGIVELSIGRVTILRLPGVLAGGTRLVNLDSLKREVKRRHFIGAVGIEAIIALRSIKADFQMYGVSEAVIEAARCGLNPLVVCVEGEISDIIKRLEAESIDCEIVIIPNKNALPAISR